MKIRLTRTTLIQDGDKLRVVVNGRTGAGVDVSPKQLDNWCVRQVRAGIVPLLTADKAKAA